MNVNNKENYRFDISVARPSFVSAEFCVRRAICGPWPSRAHFGPQFVSAGVSADYVLSTSAKLNPREPRSMSLWGKN